MTGAAAAKAQAAAVKFVGSGTAGAVTTDFTGSRYEVTVKKSDGSTIDAPPRRRFGGHDGASG